ncbi:MAG: 4Fe-4S dicluster domain-containing protein [Methylocystaceae bacterium]
MEKLRLGIQRTEDKALIHDLAERAETDVTLCYQCGKCTAGCPVAFAMDYGPRQIVRFLQLGLVEPALKAESIWLCATCETCSTRCPRGVGITELMDTLRQEALKRGIKTDRSVAAFNESFLGMVKQFGRQYEAGLLLSHNMKTFNPLKDAGLGLPMLKRGKLHPLPDSIKGRGEVAAIFKRVEKINRETGGESR